MCKNRLIHGRFALASLFAAFAILSPLTVGLLAGQTYPSAQALPASATTSLPPMNLTIVALNGTQTLLDSETIGNLPSYRAIGGYRKKTGALVGPNNYTGPTLSTLCDLVGSIRSYNRLRVTAKDGYSMTYSYEQVNGQFTTYNSSGQVVPHTRPLYPILAYYRDDHNMSSAEGPLRLAIVGSEGLFTESSYWTQQVIKLEILWAHDVSVTAISPSKVIVAQGTSCPIDITVENEAGYTETLNCTLYVNNTKIATVQTMVLNRTSTTLTLVWNTTGFSIGHHTFSAVVDAVAGETNVGNNRLTDGIVTVAHVGDINGDGKVDMTDVAIASAAFGSYPDHPGWNPDCDINGDSRIDIIDVAKICASFGWHI